MTGMRRAAAVLAVASAGALGAAAPAFAGQAYPAPGFPSGSASCVGAGSDFQAHYGGADSTFPVITHGTVGPTVSGHATSLDPGAVGEFQRMLAMSSGPIWVCLP